MLVRDFANLHSVQVLCRSAHAARHPHAPQSLKHAESTAVSSPAVSAPHIALKEWAALVAAIGGGKQTILLRKGGIREGPFKATASSFYLFPTAFHSEGRLLKPDAEAAYHKELSFDPKAAEEVVLSLAADLTGAWLTSHEGVVDALQDFHVMGHDFLEKRMKWRRQQPITVLELRCRKLDSPLVLPQDSSFHGCFSWVDLHSHCQGVHAEGQPVIREEDFQGRQAGLRAALESIEATPMRDLP